MTPTDFPDFDALETSIEEVDNLLDRENSKPPSRPLTDQEKILLDLKNQLPFFYGFLRILNNAGGSVNRLVRLDGHFSSIGTHAALGLHYTGIYFAAIDFLTLPVFYFAARLIGKKLPVSLTERAKWLYSGALLALTITTLLLPFIAVPVALATTSIGLGISLITMVKASYEYRKLNKTLAETLMLIKANEEKLLTPPTEDERTNLEAQKKALNQTKENLEGELLRFNKKTIMNKGITAGLASLTLAGLIVGIFFPPIGIGILASVGIVAASAVSVHVFKTWFLKPKDSLPTPIITEAKELSPENEDNEGSDSKTLSILSAHPVAPEANSKEEKSPKTTSSQQTSNAPSEETNSTDEPEEHIHP